MSKATRNRTRNARERIAAQQAAARRAEQRRRLLIVGGSVGLVIVIVVAFIFIKGLSKPGKTLGSGVLPASVTRDITTVPVSTLKTVNTGAIASPVGHALKPITDRPLTSAGKPEMLYIGAEYCPYCAAMRWPMAVALSRFGTFGPLKGIHSTSNDVYPNTPTLTFYQQQYSSPYLTFTPVEHQKVNGKPLQPVTKAEQALWAKYDASPQGLGYPFVDFGNKMVITLPFYVPTMLKGLTWAQVASKLKNPNDPVAQNVDGSANYITAAICKMTGNKPASVCTAAPIPTIEAKL
jgi:thiol-disulfide isomerase/thioredoxin